MARNFYIDNINDNDKLNEVSLLLNEMEEVSRIKIGKTGISFYCEDPENVQAVLNNHDEKRKSTHVSVNSWHQNKK